MTDRKDMEESYRDRQDLYYKARGTIRNNGLDPDVLEGDYNRYKIAKYTLSKVKDYESVVRSYESRPKDLKWETYQ